MKLPQAAQGEVWDAYLDPVVGHEQGRRRPCVIVSVNAVGMGPSGLAIVVPVTGTNFVPSLNVEIEPPEGGLTKTSYALPLHIRTVSRARLKRKRGSVTEATLAAVLRRMQLLTEVL